MRTNSLRLGPDCTQYLKVLCVLCLILFLTSACGVSPTALDATNGIPEPTSLRLAPGDKVRITVFGEDRLSGEFQIDNSGLISLPLTGSIQAGGFTKLELEYAITEKLKGQYLRNPKVTVDVISFRPFYVLGEVQKPGEYPFRSGLNVLSAIAIAGGATYRADQSKVMLQRSGSAEFKEAPQSPSILIMPGDVIRVPERFF